MKHDYSYGWEKLYVAVYGSVTSTQSLQPRLAGAYLSGVYLLKEEDVPKEIWPKLAAWCEALTCREARGQEGTLEATTSKLTDFEANKYLIELVDIYDTVAKAYGRG